MKTRLWLAGWLLFAVHCGASPFVLVSIQGTAQDDSGEEFLSFQAHFRYDTSLPVVVMPEGTLVNGVPTQEGLFGVTRAAISEAFLKLGAGPDLPAAVGSDAAFQGSALSDKATFWFVTDVRIPGPQSNHFFANFTTADGFGDFGSLFSGADFSYFVNDAFFKAGYTYSSPGIYGIHVTAIPDSVPEGGATVGLLAAGIFLIAAIRHRHRFSPLA